MDFGVVQNSEIQNISFILPPDGEHAITTLKDRTKVPSADIRLGLSNWGKKEWVGKLYADRTRETEFLEQYTNWFNTIELNAVFYSIPSAERILKWETMVAPKYASEFLFLPKVSRVISHIKRLNEVEKETEEFINTVKLFGAHLGPILLQVGDNFAPKKLLDLELFIKSLPRDQRFFIELRHEEWFSNPIHRKAVFSLLAKYKIGSVIADTPGRRDCVHMELTVPEAYIRFNGLGSDHQTIDYMRIDEWADRLKAWLNSGLEKVYFIVSQKDEIDTPLLAQYAIERFNEKLGANIPLIVWKS